jgi:hypothetical protein
MKGWKTWVAVLLAFAYGIGGYLLGLHSGDQAFYYINLGIGFLGIGHKVEKAQKAQKEAITGVYEKAKTDALADLVRRNSEH